MVGAQLGRADRHHGDVLRSELGLRGSSVYSELGRVPRKHGGRQGEWRILASEDGSPQLTLTKENVSKYYNTDGTIKLLPPL